MTTSWFWLAVSVTPSVSSLTVGTSVDLQPQSHPPVGVPVGRDEPQEASDDRLLQLVLNHAVCIAVAGEGLDNTDTTGAQPVTPSCFIKKAKIRRKLLKLRDFHSLQGQTI